jgi:hypothetical protein
MLLSIGANLKKIIFYSLGVQVCDFTIKFSFIPRILTQIRTKKKPPQSLLSGALSV